VVIFSAKTDVALINVVLARARLLRDDIQAGNLPALPEGVQAPKDYYERAWPCYYYAPKKKRIGACPFFEYCHGKLPVEADSDGSPKRSYPRRKKSGSISFNS
jgi:hypothetical protein